MPTLDLETGPTLLHPAPPHKINKVWDERYLSPYLNKLRVVSLIAPPLSSQESVGLEDYASFFRFADLGFNPTGLSIKGVQISLPIMKASNSLLLLLLLPTTYYLLPTTYYLLPTTYYLLPTTYYLLPTTYYLLPTTYYLLPTTYYLLPNYLTT